MTALEARADGIFRRRWVQPVEKRPSRDELEEALAIYLFIYNPGPRSDSHIWARITLLRKRLTGNS